MATRTQLGFSFAPPTKQPSTAAMEAIREIDADAGIIRPNDSLDVIAAAAIIDRHLAAERQEVRLFVTDVLNFLDGAADKHDLLLLLARAESLLARIGGE